MTSTLHSLLSMLDHRFPDSLPIIQEGTPMTEYDFLRLQANREVVDYIFAYLQLNEGESRDELFSLS